ncbi:MAG TPA: NUDIX hydrolase [Candidatus Phocaeicola caecigallinarum]|nr:NUDIX hydrolase [Candidatus Phocaeicola caecigallinarum]
MLKENNQDRKWTVLESEYLIRRPWLTARKDHVLLPTGAENKEYYVLEYPDWINVLAITRDGKFLMERQYRHGLGMTCYEICAGVCEKGESPLESARRELYEETGFGGGEWQHWMDISANPSTNTNLCHCFLATGVERVSAQHLEETEDISVELLTADEVRTLLLNDQIKQALMAAPLWKYFAVNGLL